MWLKTYTASIVRPLFSFYGFDSKVDGDHFPSKLFLQGHISLSFPLGCEQGPSHCPHGF